MKIAMCLGYGRGNSIVVVIDTEQIEEAELRAEIEEAVNATWESIDLSWANLNLLRDYDLNIIPPEQVTITAVLNAYETY